MANRFATISPVDGAVLVERDYADDALVASALERAEAAQRLWRSVSVAERGEICSRFVDAMEAQAAEAALEITLQMGRPVKDAPGEVRGLAERSRYMISIAAEALHDLAVGEKPGFTRFIRREPLGVVLVLAPWNYPYLTAINAVIPALMAGNVVLIKHATQTPLCAERLAGAFAAAGLPDGVFQYLHLDHPTTARLIASANLGFVAFTGSVRGGRAVERAGAGRFLGMGLELGGKDPAYVRPDAPLEKTAERVAEGAFYNAGQSCCAVERVYVHRRCYDDFLKAFMAAAAYRVADPRLATTNLGPMVRGAAADAVRAQVRQALAQGATTVLKDEGGTYADDGSPYLAPQVLVGVDHQMALMTEETFGPAVGVMAVESDAEAIRLMNDSPYGLTASLWTSDANAALHLADQLETGTVFLNRCDYLDPALAWTGVKDSGRGCSLSRLGYAQLTRPKSFHFRTAF